MSQNHHPNTRCNYFKWEDSSKIYQYGRENEDFEEEYIFLTHGGIMKIDRVPADDDNPWSDDNDPLGPQAA